MGGASCRFDAGVAPRQRCALRRARCADQCRIERRRARGDAGCARGVGRREGRADRPAACRGCAAMSDPAASASGAAAVAARPGSEHQEGGFNLSAWALRHQSLVFFLMAMIALFGLLSYTHLSQSEDPPFTFKVMV